MRLSIEAVLDYGFAGAADVLLQIEVAALPDQRLESQSLVIGFGQPDPRGGAARTGSASVAGRAANGGWRRDTRRSWRSIGRASRSTSCPATRRRGMPRDDDPVSAAEPLLRVGPFRRFRPPRIRRAGGRRAGGGAGRLGRATISTYARRRAAARPPRCTPSRNAAASAATMRICWSRWRARRKSRRGASRPMRRASIRPISTPSPNSGSTAAGIWSTRPGWRRCADIARVCVGRDATDIAFMTMFGTAQPRGSRRCWSRRSTLRLLESGTQVERIARTLWSNIVCMTVCQEWAANAPPLRPLVIAKIKKRPRNDRRQERAR